MERENSKLRSKEKLAYVDAVRSLAAYVRKRDPRYKVFAEEQERERLRKMAEEKERIRKEKQERAERAKQWKPQAWEVIDRESKELSHDEAASGSSEEDGTDGDEDEDDFFEDGEGFEDYVKEDGEAEESDGEGEPEIDEELLAESEEDDLVPDDLYCAACEKRFANPASYTNHEGSKKHRENVERIKKEIDREEKLLAKQNKGKPKPIVAPKAGFDTVRDNVEDEDSEDDVPVPRRRRSGAPSPPTPFPQAHTPPDMDLDTTEPTGGIEDGFEDDETFNQPKQKSKKKAGRRKARTDYAGLMGSDSDEPAVEPPTIDSLKIEDSDSEPVKATPGKPKKARRRKDKAAATSGSPAPETSEADSAPASTPAVDQGAAEATLCLVCGVVFPSRTKLFAHVKSTGHAVPATVAAAVAAARQAEMEEGTRKGKKGKRR
jgi:DnaJ family protein A protein 5